MNKLAGYLKLRGMSAEELASYSGVDGVKLKNYVEYDVDTLMKSDVDKILKHTGMEYEKLFKDW